MKHYDVIVIGSGGGSKITRPAAALGHSVAIIEKGELGGTCLNHGCIPSKMLIHPADVCHEILEAKRFSISVNENYSVNFPELVQRVTKTVNKESEGIEPLYQSLPGIDLYKGTASFKSNNVIEVNGELMTAPKIFVCAGCRAHVPHIRGLEKTPYLTYKEILRLEKKPRKLLIIGGGFIAVELGYFYAMMGTQVEFILRSSLMSTLDDDIITEFTHSMSQLVTLNCDPNILRVHHKNDTFTVMTEKNIYDGDALLIATGMTPNTDILHLKNTDIACDDKGFIKVDESLETTVKGVYAFGDIIGRHMFRHTANYEGEYVFSHVFKNNPAPIKYPPVPYAVFSNPQIAGVGESEKSVKEKNIPTILAVNTYKKSAMGMALLSETGFCKLLFNKDTRALIGAHIIGREASTMIHMCIAYMKMNATVDDMSDTIYIHPALPEIVRNAVRDAVHQFSLLK